MRRGEIYIADLEPARGSKANKRRPVVIVSNNASNEITEQLMVGMITVVPLTTQIERVYHFQVLLLAHQSGLDRDCKAQAEQIRGISTNRLQGDAIGFLDKAVMGQLDAALRIHLSL